MSYNIIKRHIKYCHTKYKNNDTLHIILYYFVLYYTILYYIILCCIISYYVILYYFMSYYIIQCFGVLIFGMTVFDMAFYYIVWHSMFLYLLLSVNSVSFSRIPSRKICFFFTMIPTIVLSFHSNQIAHFCLGIINVTYRPMIHSFDLNQSHQNLSFLIYCYQFLLNS